MTSLNGNGFSISLLRLVNTGLGKGRSMLELLDAPHEALGWPSVVKTGTWETKAEEKASDKIVGEESIPPSGLESMHMIQNNGPY